MLKKYPFVKQAETKDCAVSCIEMIFKYYGGSVNKLELQDISKTNRNGTTAFHIIETLKYYGFEAKGLKCIMSDLNKVLFPAIAHVTIDNTYNHYVVIYEINFDKKRVLIADPSDKVKKISLNDFEKIYNNVLITMSPIKKLPSYTGQESKIEFSLKLVSNHKKIIIKLSLLSLFIAVLSMTNSFYLKYMLDNLYSKNTLKLIFLVFLHFYLFNIFTDYFRNKLLLIIKKYIDYDLTTLTFKHIIYLPYRYYAARTTGDIVSRINDLEIFKETLSRVFINVFIDIILILSLFIALYFINSKLFIIALLSIVFYIAVMLLYKNLINRNVNDCQKEKSEITNYIVESISNYETIKGLNLKENIINKFCKNYSNYLNKIFKVENIYNSQNLFKNIIGEMVFIITIYIGCLEVINNNITIGELMTFNSLLIYFLTPIKELINMNSSINVALISLKRIMELYYTEKKQGILASKIKGNISLKNLDYSYNERDLILKDITINIKVKEKVLIIGGSGSGKSTLLKLIKKYYQVRRNLLTIDNKDINDYKNSTIEEEVCYIAQNENLFTDTLYNNLKLNRNILEEDIEEVRKICCIDFLDNNLGFNMFIEENGFNISGGQRQRIVLARSLLSNFSVLLMDEATNEMDHNLERKIFKNLFRKFKDRTIIVVSHKHENIDLFDKIVKLKNGKLDEVIIRNG